MIGHDNPVVKKLRCLNLLNVWKLQPFYKYKLQIFLQNNKKVKGVRCLIMQKEEGFTCPNFLGLWRSWGWGP